MGMVVVERCSPNDRRIFMSNDGSMRTPMRYNLTEQNEDIRVDPITYNKTKHQPSDNKQQSASVRQSE
jgi:hypothetical protein